MLSVGPETALLWDLTNGNPVLFDLAAKDSGYIDRILPALNFEETSLLMFSEGSHVELWYLEDILDQAIRLRSSLQGIIAHFCTLITSG